MTEPRRGEKHEKEEEKNREKEEKSWEEKWREDPLNAAVWAGILIWAGVALLLGNLDVLKDTGLGGWDLVFAGAGAILLLEAGVRLLVPAYRRPILGTVILGLVFLSIGLGDLVGWEAIWPLAIILIGVALLLRGFVRR
jgi:low affinity Fe/Cu permease